MADPAEALGLYADRPDEYSAGPRRRGPGPERRGLTAVTVVGAVLVGVLLTLGVRAGREAAATESMRNAELVSLVREQRDRLVGLRETLDGLDAEVQRNEERLVDMVPALDEALASAETTAGIRPLQGPGLLVTLSDAPPDCLGAAYLCTIQDYDLQLAVNNLFAAGAEAVAVNGERVIATTAIRSAGSQITANYRILAPPYEIRAIGDPEELSEGLADVETGLEAASTGLGFEVAGRDDIQVPGIGVPEVRVARPAEPSAPAGPEPGVDRGMKPPTRGAP